jgi:hypothetical protein
MEDRESGERFAVDILGVEDGDHLPGEVRDRRDTALLGVDESKVERHKSSVIAHVSGDELGTGGEEKLCRRKSLVECGQNEPLGPGRPRFER